MFTLDTYYIESQRRQQELDQAQQYRQMQSAQVVCESNFTKLSIRMLDAIGSKLVQWGSQLQCRCAEISLDSSKRAV